MLRARSLAEARLYIEQQPCGACGQRAPAPPSRLVERGDGLAVAASDACPHCGAARAFELELGDERLPPGVWGGREPSTLIDAGEWLALAEHYGAVVPSTREGRASLALGIAAVEEVLKFMPAGTSEPPRAAFFTSRGREHYLADPAKFRRDRLELLVETWREIVEDAD